MLREDGGTESFTIKGDGKDNTDDNSINLKLYKSEEFHAYESYWFWSKSYWRC